MTQAVVVPAFVVPAVVVPAVVVVKINTSMTLPGRRWGHDAP